MGVFDVVYESLVFVVECDKFADDYTGRYVFAVYLKLLIEAWTRFVACRNRGL